MGRIAILLIGAYLLYTKVSKAAGLSDIAKQVKVSLTGVNLKKSNSGFFSTTIYPKILITNPTTSSAKIDSISGSLFIDNTDIGSYLVNGLVVNPGQSTFEIPVTITNLNLLSYIVAAMVKGNESGQINFKLTGLINTGSISANFSEKYTFNTKKIQSS